MLSASDLVSGSLNGTITTAAAGEIKLISIPIRKDNLTEDAETLTITLDDSSSTTASLVVNDTSKGATSFEFYSDQPSTTGGASERVLIKNDTSSTINLLTTDNDGNILYTIPISAGGSTLHNTISGNPNAIERLNGDRFWFYNSEKGTIVVSDSDKDFEPYNEEKDKDAFLFDFEKPGLVEVTEYQTTILADENILGPDPVLIKGLTENITRTDGEITEHYFLYAGARYDSSDIDSLMTVVTRNGEFTDEFSQEISDYASSFANATYSDVVKIVGSSGIDGWLVKVAGDDGNYIG